jgi:hypothetical protein
LPVREAVTFQGLIDRYVNEEIEKGVQRVLLQDHTK